ncbi:hypothetical protein KI387_024225, partial [Taxus chinensis]
MPNLAAKMDTQQEEAKSSTRLTSASNIREHDTDFLATRAKIWIENVLEKKYHKEETVADLLADGEILYEISKLINELLQKKFGAKIDSPVSEATHFGKQSGKYLPYSHIDSFLKICKKLGLPGVDLFSPPDAVEKRDVRRVCLCIRALSKKARSKDLDVPDFDLVTDSLLMPTDMVDAKQKYLEQNVYAISSKTECNSGPESKKKSRKNNEPFFTGPFEISPDNPDEAESKLKNPVLESSDSILGKNTVATIAIYPVSPRSPYLTIHGSSSENSTVGGSPIRNSLAEANAPLIPETNSCQKDNEGSRIKYTVLTDALNGYLEKSGSLTMENSLTEIKDPPTPANNEGKICNEHPTIIVKDIKDPVNGELEKIVTSNSDESIHEDEVDTPQLLSSLFSFVALEGDSDDADNVNDKKADGVAVQRTTRSFPTTNSTRKMIASSIPVFSVNDSVDYLNDAQEEGGRYTSVSVFLGNEKGINDVEIECKNVTKTEIVEFATANPPKLDSFDAGPENVLKGRNKEFGNPSASEAVSYTNPEIVLDVNNVNYYNVNEPKEKIECLNTKYARKGKLNIVDIDRAIIPTENILDIVNENVSKTWRVDVGPTDAPKLRNLDVGHENGWKGNNVDFYTSVPQAVGIDTDTTNISHVNNVDGCNMHEPQIKCVEIDVVNEAKPDNGNTIQTGILDTGRANMPKPESMDVDCISTKPLLVTIDAPSTPVLVSNNAYEEHRPAFLSVSNGTGQGELTNGDGIYANVLQKEEVEGGPTNILDIVNENVPKAWRVDVGPTDAPKFGSLDVGHENGWKGNSVDSYTIVPQAVAIYTDTTNVPHVTTVDGCYMCQPQTKCVEIDFVNEAKPDNGNTAQTDIVDMWRANMPKTKSVDVDCIPTKPMLVTTDAPSIPVLVSNNAYEDHGPPFLSVSNGTRKGELINRDGIYANVLQEEEVEGGSTNAPELDSLDVSPKNAQKADILFCGRRFAPQTVSVDIDQCVNKERSDTDCGATPKRESVDMVNISVSVSKVNSVDIKCTVEVEEEAVAISGNALEADNVDNESMKVLKSETVVDSAANRKTRDITHAIVTGEDTFVNAAGKGLETDNVDHEATDMTKSEIIDVDSVMNKKTWDIKFADLSAEDYVVNARKGLEADIVNEDCKRVLKSETVDVISAKHMRTCNMNCEVVTEEDSVNTANGLEVIIVTDCKKIVEVDSAPNMKTKINCSSVAEECVVDVGHKQVADNIDGDSINVLKPDIVDVDSPANTKTGDVNCAVVTDEICAANAGDIDDNSKDVLKLETVDVWSVVDMEMGDINCADVTEEDFIFNNDYSLGADNVDNDCKNVLKPETIGADSAVKTKTGYTKFPVVTEAESSVNAGNGLEEDINNDHSKKLLKSDASVDSAVNEKTSFVKHAIVVEEVSIGNTCSGLEANNFDDVPISVMNSETVAVGTAVDSVTRDIGCSVVIEEDHAAYAGKGWEAHHVFEVTTKMLKLETFGFDSAVNIKTRDINCPGLTEVDSVVNSGNKLEAENIYDYARNVLKLETDSLTNMKTRDINGEDVSDDNNFINAGNVSEENKIHKGSKNMLKLETVGVEKAVYIKTGDIFHIKRCEPSETPEENVSIARESRNQLKSSTVCERGYDDKDQRQLNETETSSPEKDETTETKHIRKPGRKGLFISLFACGFAVVGAALVTIQWRK